jgi:transketolase
MTTAPPKTPAMREAFLTALLAVMEKDERIFFLSADFGSPVIDTLRTKFPDRFINVGVAEQNLINVSTGLALEGNTVFAYAIAPFITMRCCEQIRVNLALLSEVRTLNVNLIGVGAGYSYVVSGPTHQCLEDLSIMRALPNMQVYSPADSAAAAQLLQPCLQNAGPKYLRFDVEPLPALYADKTPDIKRGFHVHHQGKGICLVATGYMVHTALAAAERLKAEGHHAGVIDLFSLSRFSADEMLAALHPYKGIVTLEEGFQGRGGLDALIAAFVARHNLPAHLLMIGVEGGYRFDLGTREQLHKNVGIDTGTVVERINKFFTV